MAALDHRGHEGAHAAHEAEHVDVEDALPLVHRHPVRRTEHRDPGVVHQQVDGAELRNRGRRQRVDVGVARDVAAHRETPASERGDRGGGLTQALLVDVGDHDVGAAACQFERGAAPDPAGTTRDHCRRPLDLHAAEPTRRVRRPRHPGAAPPSAIASRDEPAVTS